MNETASYSSDDGEQPVVRAAVAGALDGLIRTLGTETSAARVKGIALGVMRSKEREAGGEGVPIITHAPLAYSLPTQHEALKLRLL